MSTQTKAENFLADVELSQIQVSKSNAMFRDPSELTDDSLQELSESIKRQGLLQPLLLRAHGNGSFILVAGERRFRASKLAGLKQVPAYVRTMTEAEALDMQLTENLQRKDVHPIKEARAYAYLIKQRKISASEIALRFAKSENYVAMRLKLNDLDEKIAEDFAQDRLSLSQALIIARLQPADQKEIRKHCTRDTGEGTKRFYETVAEIEAFIQRHITRDLSKVPWKLEDPAVHPAAGPCTTCTKRSGAQNSLFADIKKDDRCFDPVCFKAKLNAGGLAHIQHLIETKPDTIFAINSGYQVEKPTAKVLQLLQAEKIKPLDPSSWATWERWDPSKKISVVMINGDDLGKSKSVYVQGDKKGKIAKAAAESGKMTAADAKDLIKAVRERLDRAGELAQEKVYEQTVEALRKLKPAQLDKIATSAVDNAMAVFIIIRAAGYNSDDIEKMAGLRDLGIERSKRNQVEKYIERLKKIKSHKDVGRIVRQVMIIKHAGTPDTVHSVEGQLLLQAAREWGVPVNKFEKEQHEILERRKQSAAKRIKEIQSQVKGKKNAG